ncbi:hypothetical protein N183_15425 [Sinorhizobium sp. Sb3]|uniref:HAD family hydrolase n=1 Tax=Sinorhizobium sp. Sb3 TaxID=1358417 RepID=UPI00071D8D50|nr:HAD family phosphatase [Sinorhizobium sp. Sb3]KSV81903.1 hypothetical protein N183_15425 [Sinorhizobium sp. Sb3]
MNDIKLVIFDCDGVLVDSEIIGIKIETELLRIAGYEISVERMTERFAGMNWKDILLILEHESGLKLMGALLDKTETELDARLPTEVEAIAGVRRVLEELRYQRCVCSNTKKPRLEAMLTKVGLKDFFGERIFSAKDLGEGRSKPKPDIFLFGAHRMGFDPSQTVVVEDSVHGVQAARTAGMAVIGFTGGSHTFPTHAENLRRAGASLIVSHMSDVPAAISELANSDRR